MKKCYCGKLKGHSEKELAKSLAKIIKITQDSIVEYKIPRLNGKIGSILGVPIFIKKK